MKKSKLYFLFVTVALLLSVLLSGCGGIKGGDGTGENGAENKPFSMAVISDIHLLAQSEIVDVNSQSFADYQVSRQRILSLSEAIFHTAVDDIIASDVDVLLVSGDMSENGSKASMAVLTSEFERLEQAGVTVCVTGGMTDFRQDGQAFTADGSVKTESVTTEEIPVLFEKYGFGEALTRDTDTQSYVTDLPNGKYRLMVVDTASLYEYDENEVGDGKGDKIPEVTDELIEYLEQNLIQAEEDGKEVIVMSYFPVGDALGDYIGMFGTVWSIVSIDRHEELLELFRSHGVRYCFSGRLHSQKETVLEATEEYAAFTEYGTACLCNYPVPIRYFTADEDGTLTGTEKRITAVKEEYLPSYLNEETREKAATDLLAYGKEFVYNHTMGKFQWSIDYYGTQKNGIYLELFRFAGLYGKEGVDDSKAIAYAEGMAQYTRELAFMPIYGENSIESECLKYGIQIPKTNYTDVMSMVSEVLCGIYADDMHLEGGCDEAVIFRYIVYQAFESFAACDMFAELSTIDSSIQDCDMQPMVDKMYRTDILDLTVNDFIMHIVNLFSAKLFEKSTFLKIRFKSSDAVLDTLAALFPVVMTVALGPEYYDSENETLWGIPYTEYINLSEGLINMQRLIDDFVIDIVVKQVVY